MNENIYFTKSGFLIAKGKNRIVTGSRGSYYEFTKEQIAKTNLYIPAGEIYRLKNDEVYYIEFRTLKDYVKVYLQKRTVKYADYKTGMYYVSTKDVTYGLLRLAIVGSRTRKSANDMMTTMMHVKLIKPDLIISGACNEGGDQIAKQVSKEMFIKFVEYEPNLKNVSDYYDSVLRYYDRNKLIADNSDKMLALVAKNRKGGTEHAIKMFKRSHKDWKKNIIIC